MKTTVWDVDVPNHIIFVGRNGKYSWQGNCSETSSRGPHVTQVIIDEACVGEAKSTGGSKSIRAARYQLSASTNSLLGLTSTAQFILGTFYHTWTHAEELGYKRYRWSIARHISESWWIVKDGIKVPNWRFIDEILYKDRDPNHWIPNVWWISVDDVRDFRTNSTDDEFLVEVLGGISKGSGLVFSRDDLNKCICDGKLYNEGGKECEECIPYSDSCPAMKAKTLTLPMISERMAGADFGDIAPNALTATGRREGKVYVLYSDERTGISTDETIGWIMEICTKYNIWEIYADPERGDMREALSARGLSTPHAWAGEGGGIKIKHVNNVKRHIERGSIFIPKKFNYLVQSLSELSYNEDGSIKKSNDHSFDSLMFAMIDYDVDDEDTNLYKSLSDRLITKIW